MEPVQILWITLILYIIGLILAYKVDANILLFVSLLWLVPVYIITNTIILLFCIIMFIIHITIPLSNNLGGDDFD